MNDLEKYEFDREGFLVIRGLLRPAQAKRLLSAVMELEKDALGRLACPPQKKSLWGPVYHVNLERGYHAGGGRRRGQTLMIEDFFNADPAFDVLLDHARTMSYIRAIVQGPVRINNSELRIRYPGNTSISHMGGPIDHKYRYGFNSKGIDCMMVRMVYFLHDVAAREGAFCVVPGTHKTNYRSPYGSNPAREPGMKGLPVRAGDGILFTENVRHGGLKNLSLRTRRSIHVGYGPAWMMSQNMSTMDEPQFVTPKTLARLSPNQRRLFVIESDGR